MVFWKCQGKAMKFLLLLLLLLFASCTCNVERIYRRVVPKAKNEVGNRNFNLWPQDNAISYSHVVDVMRLDILVRMDNRLSFLISPGKAFIDFGNIVFWEILGDFELFLKSLDLKGDR